MNRFDSLSVEFRDITETHQIFPKYSFWLHET